ncbi:MAG: hypothetical protein HY938_11075 [Nitrosomonadales bacterium]|nr:hypothetical protein [Nitrosomonadales bacterium]
MTAAVLQFAADHPCGAGHFPGNPIIPGALLLDEVLAKIAAQSGGEDGIWQVKSAKFPQPVRPGDTVRIDYAQTPAGEFRFDCTVSGNRVLSGVAGRPAESAAL